MGPICQQSKFQGNLSCHRRLHTHSSFPSTSVDVAAVSQERLRFGSDPCIELKLAKETGATVFRMGIDCLKNAGFFDVKTRYSSQRCSKETTSEKPSEYTYDSYIII